MSKETIGDSFTRAQDGPPLPVWRAAFLTVLGTHGNASEAAEAAGIVRERIVIDPGFGFGKTLAHNLALLRGLEAFHALGVPVLAGLSRKSMLGALTGREVGDRVAASVAAALLAVQRGAAIVRVHDVRETVDALKIWNAVNEG